MSSEFDLDRFLVAQADVYGSVTAELRAGNKTGHWMWFIFPQVAGLGSSTTARFYAVASLEEAAAYAAHPVLGARLRECAQLLLDTEARDAERMLGHTDARKLRSSMTLFQTVLPQEQLFGEVLEHFHAGAPDAATTDIIDRWQARGAHGAGQ